MNPTVSVITPSLAERREFREECIESVMKQTHRPVQHLVGIDYARAGVSETLNTLWPGATGEYVAVLADDDLLLPEHLEVLTKAIELESGDVAYSYCAVEGRNWSPNQPFDEGVLRSHNTIPACALIRRSLIEALGGWTPHSTLGHAREDHDFWLRALDLGASFVCVPKVTWSYRFHGENLSLGGR